MQVSILIETLKPIGPDSPHIGFESVLLSLVKPGYFLVLAKEWCKSFSSCS